MLFLRQLEGVCSAKVQAHNRHNRRCKVLRSTFILLATFADINIHNSRSVYYWFDHHDETCLTARYLWSRCSASSCLTSPSLSWSWGCWRARLLCGGVRGHSPPPPWLKSCSPGSCSS